jgi:hypothetical protein
LTEGVPIYIILKQGLLLHCFFVRQQELEKNLCEPAKRIRNRVEKHMNQRKSRRANENRVNLTETEPVPLENRKRTPSWRDVLGQAYLAQQKAHVN